MRRDPNRAAREVKMLVLDVDGVLTDGRIVLASDGNEMKFFHAHDGQGVVMAIDAGFQVAIITSRDSQLVRRRADEMHIKDVYIGFRNKEPVLEKIIADTGLIPEQIAFMGDDLLDLAVMKKVGLPIAPSNATDSIKETALLVTERAGGHGAVREAIEFILRAQGTWDDAIRITFECNKERDRQAGRQLDQQPPQSGDEEE